MASKLRPIIDLYNNQLQNNRNELNEAQQQLASALAEKDKPFSQEAELSEKSARLVELTAALQINEREPEILEGEEPDEGDEVDSPRRRKDKQAR